MNVWLNIAVPIGTCATAMLCHSQECECILPSQINGLLEEKVNIFFVRVLLTTHEEHTKQTLSRPPFWDGCIFVLGDFRRAISREVLDLKR